MDLAENIVKAACILHNFVRQRDGGRDDINNLMPCQFPEIGNDTISRANRRGLSTRDKFADYFVEVAPLPWQDQAIH
jgi:hypothetical protein